MGKKSIFMASLVFFLGKNMNSYILLHFENIVHHVYFYDTINSYMNSYNSYKNLQPEKSKNDYVNEYIYFTVFIASD
jgi:hypothetical protein